MIDLSMVKLGHDCPWDTAAMFGAQRLDLSKETGKRLVGNKDLLGIDWLNVVMKVYQCSFLCFSVLGFGRLRCCDETWDSLKHTINPKCC